MTKKGVGKMDGKTRGGKRLARRAWGVWPASWAVIPLVCVALAFTVGLFIAGCREAAAWKAQQKPVQGGIQGGDGLTVVSWSPEGFGALCAPTEPPEAGQQNEAASPWDEDDLELIAQTIYAEADVCRTKKEKAAVAWCILNRLDTGIWGDTIRDVVTARNQFAWTEDRTVVPEYIRLAEDVLLRWLDEKAGKKNVGRVLPPEYLYFDGDGWENHFRIAYLDDTSEWGWTLPDPYGEG